MATEDQDSGFVQWGLRFFDYDPYLHSGYHDDIIQHDGNDIYHGRSFRNNDDDDAESSNNVESDEIIARTLQEEFSQLAIEEASQYSHAQDEHTMLETSQDHDWNSSSTRNYSSGIYELYLLDLHVVVMIDINCFDDIVYIMSRV